MFIKNYTHDQMFEVCTFRLKKNINKQIILSYKISNVQNLSPTHKMRFIFCFHMFF